MKQFMTLLVLAFSLSSFAGNGSSGGGNIFGDQLNPWFMQNTKSVNYCVEIAPEFSSIPKTRILESINKSFAYWKRTFAQGSDTLGQGFPLEIALGTQEFILNESCSDDIDLKFQLGFLTDDQKKELPNYRQLLGLAYRTSYDEVNLRAKGFIYIAPESGAFRPLSPNLHQIPWSFGKNMGFDLVITHEMGHLFGLQDDHYSYSGLMSAKFVENITTKASIRYVNTTAAKEIPSPFGCNVRFEGDHELEFRSSDIPGSETKKITAGDENIRVMLGLPENFKARFQTVNGSMNIQIDDKDFGQIKINEFGMISGSQSDPAITVYLTKKQRVFNSLPRIAYNTHLQIYDVLKSITRKGDELRLVNGKTLKVFIQYDQLCFPSVGMIYNDEVYFDIFSDL